MKHVDLLSLDFRLLAPSRVRFFARHLSLAPLTR
jgi:hypothetical protein